MIFLSFSIIFINQKKRFFILNKNSRKLLSIAREINTTDDQNSEMYGNYKGEKTVTFAIQKYKYGIIKVSKRDAQ